MQSFIRWAGSKRLILPRLREYWAEGNTRYIEPFSGSACFFFDIEPEQAILADINLELISTMRAIRRDVELVLQCLRRLPVGKDVYYSIRAANPKFLSNTERAARFLYLNRYCFNGLYRTNRKGEFNVPYAPPRNGNGCNEQLILKGAKLLKNAQIIHGDFEQTLSYARSGDFVYLDPPYAITSRRMFAQYDPNTFGLKDLPRLTLALNMLNEMGANFIVTYADSPEARKLLAPWQPKRIKTRRNIAGFAGNRKNAFEIIGTNIDRGRLGYVTN